MLVSKLTLIRFDAALPILPPAVAGSERLAQTNARVGGAIQKEGSFINKSLMFLGVIISRLSEGDKLAHLPFRDSKVSGAHHALQWRSLVAWHARASSGRAGGAMCAR